MKLKCKNIQIRINILSKKLLFDLGNIYPIFAHVKLKHNATQTYVHNAHSIKIFDYKSTPLEL